MLEGEISVSVNVTELISSRVPAWILNHLDVSNSAVLPSPFWIIPIDDKDPTFTELCEAGLKRLKATENIALLTHESLLFIQVRDDEGLKLCICNKDEYQPILLDSDRGGNFKLGKLNFLQKAHFVTKYELPAKSNIPYALVKTLPVFENDLIEYFADICVLNVSDSAREDGIHMLALKALILTEINCRYINSYKDLLVEVGYVIPSKDHDWIFGQIFSAILSGRLINFYLEIYKLFEFFFPLDNIFDLADRLNYPNSELVLLDNCRGALNWNVNHQRGARSAATYASVNFAEVCLGEIFDDEKSQKGAFKDRAIEKLTNARHTLTHQDFRAALVSEKELMRLTEGLLSFLLEAFTGYGLKLDERRKRFSGPDLKTKSRRIQPLNTKAET